MNNPTKTRTLSLTVILLIVISSILVIADPTGPTITYKGDSERSSFGSSTLVNNATHTGGKIVTANLAGLSQDKRWKAYVGNITGTLMLADANNYTIYDWTINSVQNGEIYATRASSVTWGDITCATAINVSTEETAMNHTTTYAPDDSISDTFDDDANDHDAFDVGSEPIVVDSCAYSINLWLNNTAQSAGSAMWEEVLLHDGNNLVYVSLIENNGYSYINGTTFDYQMILAEKGDPGQYGSVVTPYYFFVEIG